jgi:LVIVD repeat
MRRRGRSLGLLLLVVGLLLAAMPAEAHHETDPHTRNLIPLGDTDDNRPISTFLEPFFTDAAFWGDLAYQGTWNGGFRVIDISSPARPRVRSEVDCGTFQGDIGVWHKLVFRSVDTPVAATTPAETCDAPLAESGFEGIQIFRVADPAHASADDLIAAVGTDCGSHTHTVVPDPKRHRVLLYVSNSGAGPVYGPDPNFGNRCSERHGKFQIVEVPLAHPERARVIRDVKLGPASGPPVANSCHDIGVLMNGHRRLAVCAGEVAAAYDITAPARPRFIGSFTTRGVSSWHSAAFSWDGRVTVMGWEPGGGEEPRCEAGDPDLDKSVFFFDTFTGKLLGTWVLPRPQSAVENCTIHNYNVVPTGKRDVLVMGNYQAGTWVVDFTSPRHARTVAWSDPPPLDPGKFTLGGAWGSYWYNHFIYETNITEGLNIFRLHSRVTAGARRLPFLNPQSQVGRVPSY